MARRMPGWPGEAEGILADLEQRRPAVIVDREDLRVGRRQAGGRACRRRSGSAREEARRARRRPCGAPSPTVKARGAGSERAVGGDRQDLRAEPDADRRAFRSSGRRARGAPRRRASAAGGPACRCPSGPPPSRIRPSPMVASRQPSAARERTRIAEADAATLEVVLDVAQPFRLRVLDDGNVFHARSPAAIAASTTAAKSSGAMLSRSGFAAAKIAIDRGADLADRHAAQARLEVVERCAAA